MLTAERLRELLDYDPLTGIFRWRVLRGGRSVAGYFKDRYVRITISGTRYYAHRLAWLHVHGNWPNDQIDHANGIKQDNRLINLREASRSENHYNSKRPIHNKSGYKGVCWHKAVGQWQATIAVNSHQRHLGYFPTPEAAHNAYREAATKLHGSFANHG